MPFTARSILIAAALVAPSDSYAADNKTGVMYKTPDCECGEDYASYLRERGYTFKVFPVIDLEAVKKRNGVPQTLPSCHLFVTGRYVVDGHVPVKHIDRMLKDKPDIRGLSLPGKPPGSPGIAGYKREPFTIYEIGDGSPKVFAVD